MALMLSSPPKVIQEMKKFATLRKGTQVMHALPTFEAIEHYARAADSEIISIPLTSAFAHDLGRMLAAITPSTALVYICNPNNPTASLTPRKDLEAFIAKLIGLALSRGTAVEDIASSQNFASRVKVAGPKIALAGSDEEVDSLTITGTLAVLQNWE